MDSGYHHVLCGPSPRAESPGSQNVSYAAQAALSGTKVKSPGSFTIACFKSLLLALIWNKKHKIYFMIYGAFYI
jgi:hypothetical protein